LQLSSGFYDAAVVISFVMEHGAPHAVLLLTVICLSQASGHHPHTNLLVVTILTQFGRYGCLAAVPSAVITCIMAAIWIWSTMKKIRWSKEYKFSAGEQLKRRRFDGVNSIMRHMLEFPCPRTCKTLS